VAGANVAAAAARCLTAVRLAHGSWWSALPAELQGRVDLVVSNPPYVSSGEWSGLDATVTGWEPRLALDAGPTGLEDVAAVVAGAGEWLGPAGVAVVEIAPHQAEPAVDLARSAGLAAVTVVRDLAGRERMLVARRAHQPRPGDSP